MKKTAKEKTATDAATQTPEIFTYHVEQQVVWKAKVYRPGDLLKTTFERTDHKLDLYLRKGWIRDATAEDIARASTPREEATPTAAAETPLPEGEASDAGALRFLAPRTIAPSPVNPRRVFEDAPMQELTDSVREKGVRVAINVRALPPGHWFVEPGRQSGVEGWFLLDRRRFRDHPD